MELRAEKLWKCKDKKDIKRIYFNSFVKKERMPYPLMYAMSFLWNTEFLCFYDGDTLCGFVYLASIGRQMFIMFFAVDEKLRSKGLGGQILKYLRKKYSKNKIIVSIEPCDEPAEDLQLRIRRRGFYLRNGYEATGYMMKLAGQKQEILISGGEFSKRSFKRFFMLYSNLTTIPKVWKMENDINENA